ncbi:hypothetical protein [Paenibacillus sp. NPDC058071]|uniref:hypothetical protein n=1 Tax=Paenibacillus sp. NPDC058071 TaxID=3346326 RepID=UPI0036DBE3A3
MSFKRIEKLMGSKAQSETPGTRNSCFQTSSRSDHGSKGSYRRTPWRNKAACNEEHTANILNCEFDQSEAKLFVVSNLTYVKFQNRWHSSTFWSTCSNVIAAPHKDAALISRAFATVMGDFRQIQWFHTDRGSEFQNQRMDKLLQTFEIG